MELELKSLYPFKSNFLQIGENNLHYVDEGEGECIIMVHGNPTWSFYYRNVIKALSKSHRVIALDHMGCGLSDKPENYEYTLERRVSDLGALIKFLDLKKYSLMVHDWGGAIGFGHAVDHINEVNKLIILNTAAFRSKSIPWQISLCKAPVFGPFIVKYFNAFAFPATFMTTVKKLTPAVKRGYLYPYSTPDKRVAISEFVQDIPLNDSHRSFSTLKAIEEKLPLLKQKKLILWGGRDFCFHDEFFVRWQEIYPEAEYEYFKDAGHYVLEDAEKEIIPRVQKFLSL